MKRIRLGICMEDEEYVKRLGKFLMNHYQEQMELYLYTAPEQLKGAGPAVDVLLLSDSEEMLKFCRNLEQLKDTVVISLAENCTESEIEQDNCGKQLLIVDKYQDVNKIVDEILKQVGNEVEEVLHTGHVASRVEIYGVYSFSENAFQMPFAVTLGAVFGEKRHVLLLDLQENSGASQLFEGNPEMGLEDLLVMTSVGRYSKKRIRNCIGHLNHVDLVYPVKNSENLCEIERGTYLKLLDLLLQEMDYSIVIINLGTRFPGFFDVLDRCSTIYLLDGKNKPGKWREEEFLKEMLHQGYTSVREKIVAMELPPVNTAAVSCEKLVENWKWTDVGNKIRKHADYDPERKGEGSAGGKK